MELTITGGTVVTADGARRADAIVRDGRIAEVAEPGSRPAGRTVDADGLLVLPGFIDAHVHLMDPGPSEREDWQHGTAAAAASGVTTVLEHTHFAPVLDPDALAAKREYADERSRVDFGLAAHVFPESIDRIGELWHAGAVFFKAFTCTTHGVPGLGEDDLRSAFAAAAAVDAPVLVHCEDESLTTEAEQRLRDAGRSDGGLLPEWRSRDAERVASERVLRLAGEEGARVIVAHASHPDILAMIADARAGGARVFGETCPQYLTLFEEEVRELGPLRKFTPPARARTEADLDRMWEAVRDGSGVDYLSSDHAPATRAQKTEGDIWSAHFGLPGLDTTSGVLIDAAVRGTLDFTRVAELYSARPARIYSLEGRKGRIEPGLDADLVLVDPAGERTVEPGTIRSKAGWSPYEGRVLRGRVVATYLRGEEVFADGEVVGEPGAGQPVAPAVSERRAAP
jgi:allantoinase